MLGLVLALMVVFASREAIPQNYQAVSPGVSPPPGLLHWWRLGETAGEPKVYDSAACEYNGTAMPSAIGNGGPTPVTGFVGNALSFNFSSYVTVPITLSTLDLNFGNTSFSIDAWINSGGVPIVSKLSPAGGYSLSVEFGHLTLRIGPGATPLVGPMIAPGWNFVAVTVTRSLNPLLNTVNLYTGVPGNTNLNVVLNVPLPLNANASSTVPLDIGKFTSGPHGTTIDELDIFKGALTEPQLKSIFGAGRAGKRWPYEIC
ncbi:hypothetical protein HY009_08385 [Candidatus Acetothermia bacterium]|nr:hypothetical protein [Candidatus Acetothermia bacterium]